MQIDLLLRPRPRRAKLIVGAIFFIAATVGVTWFALQHIAGVECAEAELRQLERMQRKPAPLKPNPAEIEVSKKWGAMRAELDFSWYPIFRALETSNSPDIELLDFFPDKLGRRIVLRGEARDQAALTSFTKALAAQPVFHQVYLSHQKTERRQSMELLSFELRARLTE